jgi:hypothetical protein
MNKMNKRILLLVLILGQGLILLAQQAKTVTDVNQVWLGYFNQTRLTDKWGFWVDAHLRTKEDFTHDLSQAIGRVGITYYLSDATKLTAGYAYINQFPATKNGISQPEHRPWQQLQWHTNYKKLKTMQWIRLEERYRRKLLNESTLDDAYSFNFRLRYNFLLQVPLTSKPSPTGTFSFIANDEVHINFGKEIVYNTFDQNRFFLGFAYHVNKSDNIQFGYMNVFQQLPAGSSYRSLHTARVFYFHNLDLRKKKA